MKEGIDILKKGGLLANAKEIEFEKRIPHNKLIESALQIIPFPEQESNLRIISPLVKLFVKNASKKHLFSIKDQNSPLLLELPIESR